MIHLRDVRRQRGRFLKYERQGQVEQYPVICAIDVLEVPLTQGTRIKDYVTDDPYAATCRDCRERIGKRTS